MGMSVGLGGTIVGVTGGFGPGGRMIVGLGGSGTTIVVGLGGMGTVNVGFSISSARATGSAALCALRAQARTTKVAKKPLNCMLR
ncbi:hypothetical protein FA13DRAFT_204335 [Coprinellus micaceus]|uniref:Uncharacterized protein n=1 Tax=Coprinellus micaceus TaxID=71717 RepID=A0A4Y7SFR2_COPMI|nr:hypothetical protein FA13DRAFT_204335 [Coprinellus micaceus]